MSNVHIALDLDKTLAEYHSGWGIEKVGRPIGPMVENVLRWLKMGYRVTIFTARVAEVGKKGVRSEAFIRRQVLMIHNFLERAGLPLMDITATKYPHFTHFVDDKACSVEPNSGMTRYFPPELQ